jgi:signal transduction histidine kinase
LRTPITALNGVLDNLVDGVAETGRETLRLALARTERLGRLVSEPSEV